MTQLPKYDIKQIDKIIVAMLLQENPSTRNPRSVLRKSGFLTESNLDVLQNHGIGLIKKQSISPIPLKKGDFFLFWVYYPDLRPVLQGMRVYNPRTWAKRMTWKKVGKPNVQQLYCKTTLENPETKTSGHILKTLFLHYLRRQHQIKDIQFPNRISGLTGKVHRLKHHIKKNPSGLFIYPIIYFKQLKKLSKKS